jgi:hypothetical protein
MEKKRKKNSGKEAGRQGRGQKPVQAKPAPKASPPPTEKDRMILQDVEHIIWNPDLLKKLKDSKAQAPNGYSKNKKPLK